MKKIIVKIISNPSSLRASTLAWQSRISLMIKNNKSGLLRFARNDVRRVLTSGFTLVEALVAISILMIAIVSPMTIAQNGLSSAMYAREEMVGQFLAQDALEYIKNTRDKIGYFNTDKVDSSLSVEVVDWLRGGDPTDISSLSPCMTAIGCEIDTIENTVSPFGNKPLLFAENSSEKLGTYSYKTGGNVTNYKRVITITESSHLGIQALVSVKVSWTGKAVGSYDLRTYIFNFR